MSIQQQRRSRADKIHAAELRQRDTGWGYALGYCFIYPGAFHASTRQTLTPIALGWITWVCSLVLLGAVAYDTEKKEVAAWGYLASFPAALIGFKAGISWDLRRSKKFLESDTVKEWRADL